MISFKFFIVAVTNIRLQEHSVLNQKDCHLPYELELVMAQHLRAYLLVCYFRVDISLKYIKLIFSTNQIQFSILPMLLDDCKSPLDIKVHIYASCENTSFRISSVNKCTRFVNVVRLVLVFSKNIIN